MTLVSARDLVSAASAAGTGIGAFNVIHLETAEALVRASAQAQLPVILQISQNCADYHGGLEPIGWATLAVARRATTPVAVHLDHAERPGLVDEAIELGFGSVMFDGGKLPYEQNVEITADVAARARAAGVYIEAELGEVGGKDGAHAPGVRTDPDEARAFVAATGVDALAVAVGSSHAMTDRVATTGTAWLGLTLGCAQCHTHKYDPIQHREYYGVMAFLNNADEPEIEIADPALTKQREEVGQQIAALDVMRPLSTSCADHSKRG